jgi:hypothetical protein
MRRIGVVAAVFLALAALTGSAWASASAALSASPVKGTWGPAVPVPGMAALISPSGFPGVWVVTSMSCTGPGDCTAGGAYQDVVIDEPDTDQAYVVSEVNGKWGNAEAVPGTIALNTGDGAATSAVSCSSPGNCVATGYYAYRYAKTAVGVAGFVANQVNGRWQQARPVPALSPAGHFAQVTAVSCAPARTAAARKAGLNCVAAGVSQLSPNTQAGFVLAQVHGAWGTAHPVPGLPLAHPGSAVTAVSCPAPGRCGAGGYYTDRLGHFQAFVADEVNGTWRRAQQVPGTAALNAGGHASVTSVSCPAAGGCLAAGIYKPRTGPGQLFAVSEGAGHWQRALQLPGTGKLITRNGSTIGQVSCASAATCEVGGSLQTGPSRTRGFLAGKTSGRWSLYVVPDGAGSTITALSCPAPGYCAAGGQRLNSNPGDFPASMTVIDEVAGRWGKTVSLRSGYNVISATYSAYAISCAAPRSCAAGGILAAYHGLEYGVVASETPAKAAH